MAEVSLILVSHNKPDFVKAALDGVLRQTHQNWEAFVVDSGILLNQGFFGYVTDPRVKVMPSGETSETAKTHNMASWCFNRWLNSGQVSGELILYLCDDDLLYPEAFQTYWDYYVGRNRAPQAMYSSQDIGLVGPDGTTQIIGQRIADRPRGRFCRGGKLDCQVDYLQFCHTAKTLEKYREVYKTDQYHSEDKRNAEHADGLFMERIGALAEVHPINKVLSMNRRTTQSVNLDYATSPVGRAYVLLKKKLQGGLRRIAARDRY